MRNILHCIQWLFFVACIAVCMLSCSSKKKVSQVTELRNDSLIVKTENVIRTPVATELIINDICDSVEKKTPQIRQKLTIGRDTVYVEVVDNDLMLRTIAPQDTVRQTKQEIRASREMLSQKEIEYIYRPPSWAWWSVVLNLVLLAIVLKVWRWIKLPIW